MQGKINYLLIVFSLLTFLYSCNSDVVFSAYKTIPYQWHKDTLATFNFKSPDTLLPYKFFLNLRNTNDYAYNNLFLIVKLNYPKGKTITDTLQYKMAAPNGKLLGKGFSDIKENKLWYKGYNKPFKFSEKGIYTLTIAHAMRQQAQVKGIENLQGITEIGFSIESVENK